jgi:L-ribulokinase
MKGEEMYSLGIDFGSLSGRAILVNVETGEEVITGALDYPHKVMDERLPSGKKLEVDWALQHPRDYLDVLFIVVPDIVKKSGIKPEEIIGIGIDFTGCTVMPVLKDGTPLCFLKEYENEPHAYIKLWKHHASQDKANKLNEIARQRGEKWLNRYGGKISSEWLFPKIWQLLDEAPEIYDKMDYFIEAGDWVVWQLCNKQRRNSCFAGYKAIWDETEGYPTNDFFKSLDPRLEHVVDEKLRRDIYPLGHCAGKLSAEMAEKMGLNEGTPVAVANADAHVSVPAVTISDKGKMLAIMGTSTCHMLLGDKRVDIPGICGYSKDGILPGFFGYEGGQSCVGDHFAWFVKSCVPQSYHDRSKEEGCDVYQYLEKLGSQLTVGESGLLALDWWNGNRTILVDVDLSGMILGMNLQTKPEEIYRALVEATAFGTRIIIENFRKYGIEVNEFYAAGGIAEKSPFVMQIYADIIKLPVKIAGSPQSPALGAAIFGSVAAGRKNGGWDTIQQAAQAMGKVKEAAYEPIKENSKVYDSIFAEYEKLHDYFGRGENNVMKVLKNVKKRVQKQKYDN